MPKVTRNVFVSKNNHTKVTPVTRSTKTVPRSTVTINHPKKRTGNDIKINTVTRKTVTKKPVVSQSKNRTSTIVTQRKQKTNPVWQNKTTKTPVVRQPKNRTTRTVIRQKEEKAPARTKTITRSETLTPAHMEKRPDAIRTTKTRSGLFSNRLTDKHRENKTIEKQIHRPDQKKSTTNLNKNINITKNIVTANREHSPRPVIRKSRHSSDSQRSSRLNRRDRHDIKVTKYVDFHRVKHGRYPGKIFNRIIWPKYSYKIFYNWGPHRIYRYYRPYYHRKYVFVSLGGYWPSYRYARYYWYGWHPYTWYGCYPTAYQISSPTYSYYTYNNYYYDSGSTSSTAGYYSDALPAVDHTTFEDVRQRLAEQAAQQPQAETLVDKFFADGVEAFENEDYQKAAAAFADAISLDPNDVVLPFAYVQALFAAEQYAKAADILRLALAAMPADQQGLFFPRGLYNDENILLTQIEQLKTRTETFAYDLDMSLLLGYQYLGVENYEQARYWLNHAEQYQYNKEAATTLLKLLDMLQEQQTETSA